MSGDPLFIRVSARVLPLRRIRAAIAPAVLDAFRDAIKQRLSPAIEKPESAHSATVLPFQRKSP